MSDELQSVGNAIPAADKELAAAILMFEAAVFRGDVARIATTTEAAHAALQERLDAHASLWAVVKRDVGRTR